jgi:hypothetical protein
MGAYAVKPAVLLGIISCYAVLGARAEQPSGTLYDAPPSSVAVRYAAGSKAALPVQVTDNGILFQVTVNDSREPLYFTIDSGAGSTYFDTEAAKRLGLIPSGAGSVKGAGKGVVSVQHLKGVRFELPGVTTVHPEINTADLSGLERQGWGHPISGIFGYDFIRQFVMTFDYDNRILTLSAPGAFEYNGSGEILPIEFRKKWPYIHATIKVPGLAPVTTIFVIDCTSSDGANHQLIKKSTAPLATTVAGVGLGQAVQEVAGRLEYFQLGTFVIRNVPSVPFGDDSDSPGQIGSAILKRFKVIFNYSKSQLILEPGRMYDQPFTQTINEQI